MTLVSVLVAVALTSALAMAVSKLVSNQAKLNKVMTLTDQRDMIMRFYSALMHNRVAWRCTLYDPDNSSLLTCISGTTACSVSHVQLKTPDCKFKQNATGRGVEELRTLIDPHGTGDHYQSSGTFFETSNEMRLGESITQDDPNGWWKVKLTALGIAKGSVDLTLTIEFDEDKYKAAHANFDPPDIRDTVEYKVRYGDPNIDGSIHIVCESGNQAVVTINDLNAGSREVTCSADKLVNVSSSNARPHVHKGKFLHTLADGTDARVGSASGTTDRTGLRVENVWPFAIANITNDGDYEHVGIGGTDGVLTQHCRDAGYSPADKFTLHRISGVKGSLNYGCTYNLGPRGKQGRPGKMGYEGDKGPRGDPAPPCGS